MEQNQWVSLACVTHVTDTSGIASGGRQGSTRRWSPTRSRHLPTPLTKRSIF